MMPCTHEAYDYHLDDKQEEEHAARRLSVVMGPQGLQAHLK